MPQLNTVGEIVDHLIREGNRDMVLDLLGKRDGTALIQQVTSEYNFYSDTGLRIPRNVFDDANGVLFESLTLLASHETFAKLIRSDTRYQAVRALLTYHVRSMIKSAQREPRI